MSLEIRSTEPEDFEYLIALFRQLWPDKPVNAQNLTDVFTRGITSINDEYITAAVGTKPVGFCSFTVINSFWQEGLIAYVNELVVDSSHRGKGIGTALLNKATELAKQRTCKMIELDSGFHREQAHIFYEQIGFVKRAFVFSKKL